MSRTVELAPGISATVEDDVSAATVAALRQMAVAARHRELHGYLSEPPIEVKDGIDYENRLVLCAACGARMPSAPWPTNSNSMFHRPRCGHCHSPATYPAESTG